MDDYPEKRKFDPSEVNGSESRILDSGDITASPGGGSHEHSRHDYQQHKRSTLEHPSSSPTAGSGA
jgi:hypothetical protein